MSKTSERIKTLKGLRKKVVAEQKALDNGAKVTEPKLTALRVGLKVSLGELDQEIETLERQMRYRYAHLKVEGGRLTLAFDMEPRTEGRRKKKHLHVGWAWCGPKEQFDRAKGRTIAEGRLRKRPIHVPPEPRERAPEMSWFRGLCMEALDRLHELGEVPFWVGKGKSGMQVLKEVLENADDFLDYLQQVLHDRGVVAGGSQDLVTLERDSIVKLEEWRDNLSETVGGLVGER